MNIELRIFLMAVVLIFLFIITRYLVKKKLNLKYTLAWFATVVVLLILAIFPQLVTLLSNLIGIETPVNTVFLFALIFILIILFTLTAIVSHINVRIYSLTQKQAILEKRVRELEAELRQANRKE